jgi:hypothetical protein
MAWRYQTGAQYRQQSIRNHLNRRAKRKEKEDARANLYLDRPYHLENADIANEGDNGTLNIIKGV